MAGANNKSAKRHGYSNRQIETARASGTVLSLATLQKSAGDPAKPTKHHKALVADMADRKQGLTRKAEPPAGWKAAARGEGAEGRVAAKSARDAFVAKRNAAVKRDALVARTAKNIGDVSRIARGMQQKQAAAKQAAVARKKAFDDETTALRYALKTKPELANAVRLMELGTGPKQTSYSARQLAKAALAEVKMARRYVDLAKSTEKGGRDHAETLAAGYSKKHRDKPASVEARRTALLSRAQERDAPSIAADRERARQHLEAAKSFRARASEQRRLAATMRQAQEIAELARTPLSMQREKRKKEVGFSPSWLK